MAINLVLTSEDVARDIAATIMAEAEPGDHISLSFKGSTYAVRINDQEFVWLVKAKRVDFVPSEVQQLVQEMVSDGY